MQVVDDTERERLVAKVKTTGDFYANAASDYGGLNRYQSALKDLHRYDMMKIAHEMGIPCEIDDGLLYVNNKFLYSIKRGRWRVEGRGKWYYSKSWEDFLKRYVLCD